VLSHTCSLAPGAVKTGEQQLAAAALPVDVADQ
jgi:hypothetical protein